MPSLNIRDATDAAHSAAMDLKQWGQEFIEGWMRPEMELQQAQSVEPVVMLWMSIPPEAHEKMKKKYPEQYARVESQVNALKKKQRKEG
jgi:hypothetical protein